MRNDFGTTALFWPHYIKILLLKLKTVVSALSEPHFK